MKRFLLTALAGLIALGSTGTALALGPLDAEAELPLYSKYIWRGMNNTNGWVLQPSVGLGILGFSASVWGNMDLTDDDGNKGRFKEWDYTLAYGLGLPFIKLDAGVVFYDYPRSERLNTAEIYLVAKASVILSPSLAVYQDVDKYKGAYWAAGIGHGFTLGKGTRVDLTAGLGLGSEGFISGYFAGQESEPTTDLGASVNDVFLRADVPYHPIPFFTVTPSVTFTSLLGDAREAVENDPTLYSGKKDNFVFGLSAGYSF